MASSLSREQADEGSRRSALAVRYVLETNAATRAPSRSPHQTATGLTPATQRPLHCTPTRKTRTKRPFGDEAATMGQRSSANRHSTTTPDVQWLDDSDTRPVHTPDQQKHHRPPQIGRPKSFSPPWPRSPPVVANRLHIFRYSVGVWNPLKSCAIEEKEKQGI